MKQFQKHLLAATVGSLVLTSQMTSAEQAASITDALKSGETKLHLRARYESVSQDGTDDADATTLKTRLTYTSGTYQGFGLTLEMDDTTELIDEDYSSGVVQRGTATIADPEVTEVNQAYLSYTTGSSTLKYGRQRILLNNQRFVGGVGWRQDEQTYDAFSVNSKPLDGFDLFYAYVMDVNRIFAETSDHDHESHLLNASFKTSWGKAIGYALMLDNITVPDASSNTYGARWEGRLGEVINYNLEYATQSDAADSSLEYTADYILAELGAGLTSGEIKWNVKGGYEVLGSDDGGKGFATPLATLHAFQGWADKFLETPSVGIEDMYLNVGAKFSRFKVAAIYHSFSSDVEDIDLGSEIDLVAGTNVGPIGLTLKYANYSVGDDYGDLSDTSKVWLMASTTF